MKTIKIMLILVGKFILDISTAALGFMCMIGASDIGTFTAGLILFLISFGFYIKDNYKEVISEDN